MSFSMNLGGLFGGGKAGGSPAPAPAPAGNNQPAQPAGNMAPPAQGGNNQPPAADPNQQQQPANPFEQFQDVWRRPAANPNALDPNNIIGITPEDITSRLNSAQFAPQITPDVMQAIQNGDVTQMQGLLDNTARTTASRVMNAMIGLVNKALSEQGNYLSGNFNSSITEQLARTSMVSNNPMFANPAIKPLADVLTTQFRLANPQATPQQIEQQVTQFFQATGQAFGAQGAGTQQQATNTPAPGTTPDMDWGTWLTSKPR